MSNEAEPRQKELSASTSAGVLRPTSLIAQQPVILVWAMAAFLMTVLLVKDLILALFR